MGSILRVIGKSVACGLTGMVLLPIAMFFIVLIAAYVFDPRCGTPGDSGGCEMGAAGIGYLAVLPGFAIGVAFSLIQSYRKRAPAT